MPIKNLKLGKILMIEEVFNVTPLNNKNDYYDGYLVKTDKHSIQLLIDNYQSCCENWGFFSTPDICDNYIGAELFDVRLTDTALSQKRCFEEIGLPYAENSWRFLLDEGDIQFVDFITDKGVFQLAVYNAQNGFYGHDIKVIIDDDETYSSVI